MRGFQPQNLKRSEVEDIEAAITAVKTGDYEHVRKLYPRALTLLGDLGRSLIIAAPGHTLIGADFSAVESRVLAWVAGEQWKLDAYARYDATQDPRDEVYSVLACRMLHVPEGSFTPESPERRMGKYADLSLRLHGRRAVRSRKLRRGSSTKPSASKSRMNGAVHIHALEISGTRSIAPLGLPCRVAAALSVVARSRSVASAHSCS